MRPQGRTVEQEVARIAATQHGDVTHAQLLDADLSPAAIKRRVRKGLLIREYRGVYRAATARRAPRPPTWPLSLPVGKARS